MGAELTLEQHRAGSATAGYNEALSYLFRCVPCVSKLDFESTFADLLTGIRTIAMSSSRRKRDRFNPFPSLTSKRSYQPSQSIASPPSNTTQQSSSTSLPRARTSRSTSIPPTDELPLLSQPILITGAISLPMRQPNSAVSIHQSIADAFSKDLWSQALQKLSEQDRASILGLLPPPVSDVDSGAALLDDLCELALMQKEKCDEKRWKYHFNGQEVILRDVAQKIFHWLQKFKQAGDIAVNFDPVHAALPWAAFRFLLEVISDIDNGEIHLSNYLLTR
jgi:hypothetical protein